MKSSKWLTITLSCCFSFLLVTPQISAAKTLAKVSLSDDGVSTGLPDLFTGTMSYSIPIEVPAGRKGMDPGLALKYQSGAGNGVIGVGWNLDLGSIQRTISSSGAADYTQNNYLFTKAGSASSLVPVVGSNLYKAKIEGAFSRILQLKDENNNPYWVVTDKSGLRFFYGQTAASRQDNGNNIFKWSLDRVEDTNGNYISIFYYKDQGQIYLDRIAYTANIDGTAPTNVVNFYWELRSELVNDTTAGFTVKTAYRLTTIDVLAKVTSTTSSRIRTYKLTYSSGTISYGSLLHSVQQFDKNAQVSSKTAGIASSGLITGGNALIARNMAYDFDDYLDLYTNGNIGYTTITYENTSVTGTSDKAKTVSSVSITDQNGIKSMSYYHYFNGYFSTDFRGFSEVQVWGPVSDDGKQEMTDTYFHQGDDVDVKNLNELDTYLASSIGYTKGKAYRSIKYAISGVTAGNQTMGTGQTQKISEITNSYAQTLPSPPYFTPPNQIDSYLYDGDINPKHSKTVYDFDSYGNVIHEYRYGDVDISTDDLTIYRTYSSDASNLIVGLPTSETVYQGIGTSKPLALTNYYYDGGVTDCATASNNQNPDKGLLTRVVRWLHYDGEAPDSTVEKRMAYDRYGNLTCIRDPKGHISTVGFDPSNTYPVTTTNVLNQSFTTQYYGVNEQVTINTGLYGQVKSVTDPNLATTVKEYDSFGRPSKKTLADGNFTSFSYDNFGYFGAIVQHVSAYTSDGLWLKSYFDGFGRTILTNSSGPESGIIATDYVYDLKGRIHKSSFPHFSYENTSYIESEYDPVGRVIRTGQDDNYNNPTLTCYSKDVTDKIDPNNHRRNEVRDSAGRLIQVQEYTGTSNSCSSLGATQLYATTTYQYDVLGNLLSVTDNKGNQTIMKYDSLGRKRYMSDPDMGVWTYTYDANNNLVTQTDAKGQIIKFEYDELNRLTTKKYEDPLTLADILVLTNYYDESASSNSVGRLSRMVDHSGQTVYNYDNMGRVTSSTKTIDGTAYHLGFTFLNGRLDTITYPDNEIVSYTYDSGYLKSIAGYVTYSNFDAKGRPLNVTYGTGGASSLYSFSYQQRLNSITVISPNQGLLVDNGYGYDNKGNINNITDYLNKPMSTNISSESYVPDATHVHAVGTTGSGGSFHYDENGNMYNNGHHGITYNYDNMPTAVNSTSFTYDGNSTRVKKSSPGKTTIYISKLYECTNGICTKNIFAGSTRIATKTGTKIYFFHPDHQGSTSVITDAAGNKVDDAAYYPFGGTRQDSNPTLSSHKYTDQEQDSEIGLYNFNARLYDPELGRFMTPDSIIPAPGNPQSLNRYAYVLNNPTNFTDPSGHSFLSNPLGSINDWMADKAFGMMSNPGKTMNTIYTIDKGIIKAEIAVAALYLACTGFEVQTVDIFGFQFNVTAAANIGGDVATITASAVEGVNSVDNGADPSSSRGNRSGSGRGDGGYVGYTGYSSNNSGSGAWTARYNYSLSFDYGDMGGGESMNSSFSAVANMAGGINTATIGGFSAAQTAISRAGNAVLGMAINGPPAAQATLGFAALTVAAPIAYAVGNHAFSYGLSQGIIDTAGSLGLPPSQPSSVVQGVISLYSLYDDWISYRE